MAEHTDQSRRTFFQAMAAVGGATLVPQAGLQAATPASSQADFRTGHAEKLRQLLEGPGVVQCPVFHDMLSLKLCKELGFPVATIGGSAVAASVLGQGDYGNVTITELIDFAARAVETGQMPMIADADDGGGNPLNVHRAIRRFEHAGLAGVMLEDMHGAKHLPGLPEGPMQSAAQFVDKMKAAVDARQGRMVLVARCDAMAAGESFEQGLERLVAYAEAGADVVFLAGGGIRRCPEIAKATNRPVLSTIPPDHADAALDVLRESQVKLAVYAGHLLSVATKAVKDALVEIKQTGRVQNFRERSLPREEYAKLIGAQESVDIAKRFNAGNWP